MTTNLTWNRTTDGISARDAIIRRISTGDRVFFRTIGNTGFVRTATGRAFVTSNDVIVQDVSLLGRNVVAFDVAVTAA